MRRVWQLFLAELNVCGGWVWPVEVPLVAVLQCGERCDGFRVAGVPAASAALEAGCARFAARLCGTAADLPPLRLKLWIADHRASFKHVVDQPVGCFLRVNCFLVARAAQRASPFEQFLRGGLNSLVLECMQQSLCPRSPIGVIFAKHLPPATVHVLGQVIEVEAQPIQWQRVRLLFQLVTDPTRSVHVRDALVRSRKVQPLRLAAHQRSHSISPTA